MHVPNPFNFVKAVFTPPKGKSERTAFSLGNRPIHGVEPPAPGDKSAKTRARDTHPLSKDIEKNASLLKDVFHVPDTSDVVFRDMVCAAPHLRVTAAYVEGLASFDKVFSSVLQPVMLLSSVRKGVERDPVKHLKDALLVNGQVEEKHSIEELIEAMIAGDTVLLVQGHDRALTVETKGWEHRTVGEAVSERIVRGPQQGFVEVLRVNTALIRSMIATPDLVVENVDLGSRARNKCALLYMASLANPKAVAEARRRLHGIDTAEILTSGTLEQYFESAHSLLPLCLSTERPDRVAHFLMLGACAIIVNGDPFALIAPVSFLTFLHSPEDNYIRWPYGNLLRTIRLVGLLLVIYMPGMYVAIVNYHPELIPTSLIMAIAASREMIPFPLSFEVILMFLGFELIREAGIRIPSPIGPTIGIVGALLIGEAAVAASIVSPALVIIVAFTAVASFTIPSQELAMFTRLGTLIFIAVGATLGIYGVVALTYVMLCHAFSLKSLGMPYFSPVTPLRPGYAYGFPVIPPWQAAVRPAELRPKDLKRQPDASVLWDEGQTLPPSTRSSGLEASDGKEKAGAAKGGRDSGDPAESQSQTESGESAQRPPQ